MATQTTQGARQMMTTTTQTNQMTVTYPSDRPGSRDSGTLIGAVQVAGDVYDVTIQTSPNPADQITIRCGADAIRTMADRPVAL
jgi:hypothetical protein